MTALVVLGAPAGAGAQQRYSVQAHALATFAPDQFAGVGGGFAVWPGNRASLAATATGGRQGSDLAARAEGLFMFHLTPFRTSGIGPYVGGGAALAVREGFTGQFLVVLIGVESSPARRSGWFLEAGVGGGVRLSAGFRFRQGGIL